jgi:hypothetical protein
MFEIHGREVFFVSKRMISLCSESKNLRCVTEARV